MKYYKVVSYTLGVVYKTVITFLFWLQSLVLQSWCLFIPRILFAYYYCLVVQLVSLGPFKWFECSSAVYSTVHVDVYICLHFLLYTSMFTFFTFFCGKKHSKEFNLVSTNSQLFFTLSSSMFSSSQLIYRKNTSNTTAHITIFLPRLASIHLSA